jgi:hypothetical protein
MDGVGSAWHCLEIPLLFNNTALTQTATGGRKAACALAGK